MAGSRRRRAQPLRYAVIMAGGQSTRLWPLSRARTPKQLLSISPGPTLLQATARRLLPLVPWRRMLVVTCAAYGAAVEQQLPQIPREQILLEPTGRNTAVCIALAAEWVTAKVGDAILLVVPADHAIKNAACARRALRGASDLAARRDCLVTIGIPPTRAETGYGYIEVGRLIDQRMPEVTWVRRFYEKPALAAAARYAQSGQHLWNSGMFVWKASTFQHALELCLPRVRRALKGLWDSERGIERRLRKVYRTLPSVSVDTAVMEPASRKRNGAPRVAVVRSLCGWTDVGSWGAMADLWRGDRAGNAVRGRVVTIDTHGAIVYAPERLVALIGINDVIVVDTPDALLVCTRSRAQDVRKLGRLLRRRGWNQYV